MTLSDRRLLIELGAVLIIKLIVITLIKIHFFSPAADQLEPDPARFFPATESSPNSGPARKSQNSQPPATQSTSTRTTEQHHSDKER